MKVEVGCCAGHKGEERPVRFWLARRAYAVQKIVDQNYGPEHIFFKVRADDCNEYVLRHQTSVPDGVWELISFRERRQ